jgi:hypothetical protein
MSLELREIGFRLAAAGGWDHFAMAAGGSMEASLGWIGGWQMRHFGKARLFELAAGGVKIGQCAVLSTRAGHDLRDGVLLAPGAAELWLAAMATVLGKIGPGAYRLGSKWRLAAPATTALAALPGVTIADESAFVVQTVDFSRWPDWASYWADVSANVRRNVARGERLAELKVAVSEGQGALLRLPAVLRGSLATHNRKALDGSGWRLAAHVAGEIIACRDHLVVAAARLGGNAVSGKASIAFGRHSHYLGGGGSRGSGRGGDSRGDAGAGWLVMRALLQLAQARGPGAQFIMGPFEAARHDEALGGGLLRSRRACRVSDVPAAITRFSFAQGRASVGH